MSTGTAAAMSSNALQKHPWGQIPPGHRFRQPATNTGFILQTASVSATVAPAAQNNELESMPLVILLPIGAEVSGIRYLSTASSDVMDFPEPRLSMPGREGEAGSWFEGAYVVEKGDQLIIQSIYSNACTSRARMVRLEVDYVLPATQMEP